MNQRIQLSVVMAVLLLFVQNFAGVKTIAHRGGAILAPENTLAAYKNAVSLKADYFELDVQISSDDSLMIMHDNTVDRTTNGTGSVSAMTYAQLRALDAGSKFSPIFTGEKIPTFSEALETAKNSANNIGVVAEIKTTNSTAVQKTVAMIQKYGMQSRVILSSFNINQITAAKTLDPTIRVQLFAAATNAIIDQVKGINGEWIGSNVGTQSLVDYSHSKGILFNIWTINSASLMTSYINLGVDGMTTDDPKTLKSLSDTTAPSDVILTSATVNVSNITIHWNKAIDGESGVAEYQIYRGTSSAPTALYAKVGDTTQYIDQLITENTTYYYRVRAKNFAQVLSTNYSNEVSATTLTDVTKPIVAFITSRGDTGTVVVEFSEPVDSATASAKTNYTINNSLLVVGAMFGLDKKSVILATTKMNDLSYTLTIKSVKDRAVTPNVMITSTNSFFHKNLTSNVVSYYQLDSVGVLGSDTMIYDATIYANNGITKSGPVISEGLLGNAMSFDGIDDYVQFASSPSFNVSGAVSVSVWIKLAYLPSELPLSYGAVFDSESDNYVLYEDKGNNQLRFKVTTSNGAARPAISAVDLKTGVWIHVAGVYDGVNAMIYLNGILKGTLPLTGTVNTGQVAMLGKSGTSGTPSYFKGSIDDLQIFNKAISPAEIMDTYTTIKTAPLSTVGIGPVVKELVSKEFTLLQNYPNPFNPATTIKFRLSEASNVSLKIYDVLCREMATLVNDQLSAGYYSYVWNAGGISSGMYICRIKVTSSNGNQQKNFVQVKKLMLQK